MNISIITITFNNFEELIKTIQSTDNLGCERIVINGGSCQKTKGFLKSRPDINSISEPDKGIADAFNKGIKLSTKQGIWLLNSGDTLVDPKYAQLASDIINDYDFIHSDLILNFSDCSILKKPTPNSHLLWGMPYLHPTMVVNKKVFNEVGYFNTDFKIAMDLDFVDRMLRHQFCNSYYHPHPTVNMDGYGISNTQFLASLRENIKIVSRSPWGIKESFELIKLIRSTALNKFFSWIGFRSQYESLRLGLKKILSKF